MSSEIMVALLSLAGTLLGTFGGIVTSSKLSNYRIEQLEKKVEQHNTVIERQYRLEKKFAEHERDYAAACRRIEEPSRYKRFY